MSPDGLRLNPGQRTPFHLLEAGKRASHFHDIDSPDTNVLVLALLKGESRTREAEVMTHGQLVERAVRWLRSYRGGVVLSEQACVSGEMPDAIGWKRANHSVLVEC